MAVHAFRGSVISGDEVERRRALGTGWAGVSPTLLILAPQPVVGEGTEHRCFMLLQPLLDDQSGTHKHFLYRPKQ